MTPKELLVKLDKVADSLTDLYVEAQKISTKRKSQYLLDAVQHLKKGSVAIDKALQALLK